MLTARLRESARRILIFPLPCACILFLAGVIQTTTAEAKSSPLYEIKEPVNPSTSDNGYLTYYLDNDLFSGTDSNYTNGARLSYITSGKPAINVPFIQKNLRLLSGAEGSARWIQKIWGFSTLDKIEYNYGFALSQLMFTPETFETPSSPAVERPYAGWLGVSFSLHARNKYNLNSVEISIGTVGPHAYAQESQDFIHQIINEEKFRGWDSQIPNEVTLNITFNQKRRWGFLEDADLPLDLEIDGFHETGISAGNYLTDIHLGGLIRLGWNLPVEFSDSRLTPTAHTQRLFSNGDSNDDRWSLYAIFGARSSVIYHDITLDGPVFRSYDTGIRKELLVGEVYAGFGLRRGNWELGYVHAYRSKEFETQNSPQAFGSVAIRKRL